MVRAQAAGLAIIGCGAMSLATGWPATTALAQPVAIAPAETAAGGGAPDAGGPTYADLIDLADRAQVVVRVRVTSQATVAPERAPGVAPGFARLYIEAETLGLIAGSAPLGERLRYLVDVPTDAKGRPPKLRKQAFIVFAQAVPDRPGTLQLVGPRTQLPDDPALVDRLRPIVAALAAADAPPHVTGVRDVLSVEGNLVGESETQLFLTTREGDPASITVVRRPGQAPQWGVSFTELIDQSATAPRSGTLAWYRLACALPPRLPETANLSSEPEARRRAAQDYAFVIAALGPCRRTLADS